MNRASRNRRIPGGGRKGVALIIVLAFVVLLTGLIIAFFSRSILDRQISNSSVSRGKVSAFADGATDAIIGELKQEIVLSSSATAVTSGTIYMPLTPAAMLPQISGTTTVATGIPPNLLKRSAYDYNNNKPVPFYIGTNGAPNTTGSIAGGAIAVSSTVPSMNGRYFTTPYWNAHYLLPLIVGATDSTPLTTGSTAFTPPDWVLVARDGSNPTAFSSSMTNSGANPIVGRYAFAIYHEGGLLDVNAAGYPVGSGSAAVIPNAAYKPALAYADLTQLPGGLTTTQIDKLVAWRNYASIPVPGSSFLSPGFTAASGSNYYNAVVSNTTGFLSVSGTGPNNGQTDQMFSSRQELIQFMKNGLVLSGTNLNVLNYLTSFSRDINQPTYIPPVQSSTSAPVVLAANLGGNSAYYQSPGYGDRQINPSFPGVRVQTSFTRNDGSTANVGDPLVNKRFALQRLAWITYKGPSGGGNRNLSNPSSTGADADIWSLENTDGISANYLAQGTPANIRNYFGLAWSGSNWNYVATGTNSSGGNIIMLVGRPAGTTANSEVYVEDANRDPNFFELLKAGIAVGSLGKAAATSNASASGPSCYAPGQVPANFRYPFDTSVDYHVVQIGANILSEVNPTSYPVRITFNDGSSRGAWEFQGVTDLPYLNYVFNGVLRTQWPNPGVPGSWTDSSPFQYPVAVTGTTALSVSGSAYMVQVPAVWNPYDPNGTIPPGTLRPSQFRILVDSNDPVSLSGSGSASDVPIWHAAEASNSIVPGSGGGTGNQGLSAQSPIYSFSSTVTGVGVTKEKPGSGSTPGAGTPVTDGVLFTDAAGTLYREPTLIFSTTAPGNATRVNALAGATGPAVNITGTDANPLPRETDGSTGPWAPLVIGEFPLAFSSSPGTSGTTYYTGDGLIGNALGGTVDTRVYFTYRLQYQDPSRNWVTYDTKYGRTTDGMFSYQCYNGASPCVTVPPNGLNPYSWASAMDPRSARFGLISDTMNPQRIQLYSANQDPPATGWIYNAGTGTANGMTTVGITYPIREDNSGGFYFLNLDSTNVPPGGQTFGNGNTLLYTWFPPTDATYDIPYPTFSAGWTSAAMNENGYGPSTVWMFAPGMYAQNNPSVPFLSGATIQPSYYADPDGVVRRAAGAYVASGGTASATTPVGLPPASIQGYAGAVSSLVTPAGATPFTQSQSRPLLLHRPFRNVAELGYVFRDVPWKNLDFFTPESGDAGLLDLFCINDTSTPNCLVAGKVNLNTRQAPVLTAIISGAYVDDPKITYATVGSVSPSVASTISGALVARTSGTNYGPIENLSELVGKWNAAMAATSGTTYSPPSSSGATWAVDLPLSSGYMDGKLSYVGFSGAPSVSGTMDNLTDVFVSVSGTIGTNLSQVMRFREAPIRALASVGQTRLWNLLIDVVAQTGRYPSSAASASNPLAAFNVEGQQHYWVHVAIDRFTGQVLDKQIEVVKE